jgi:hypothetical protein
MSKLKDIKKAENPSDYAKQANEGIMLGYPVKIAGKTHRNDTGTHYHSTIKVFNKEKDHPHAIHNLAQHLPLNAPDAKNTQIEPGQFKDRKGNDVFVIKLHGRSADKLKEHHARFAHMGDPENYDFQAHISVPKSVHDEIKSSGAKTAHEAGIEFGNAELKAGPRTLKTYHHEADSTEPKVPDYGDFTSKIKKSENLCAVHKAEKIHGKKPLMKPYVSEAQRRWAHTPSGKKALGGNAGVHEWDEATKGKKLPEKVMEKGALKNAAIAGGMLLGSHAHAASGHLHQFVSGMKNLPGVKAESVFTPYKKGSSDGQGQYRIKVGNYTINGEHHSVGGNNQHKNSMDGPKNPSPKDKEDEGKAQFLRNKINTVGQNLLDKSLEKSALKNAGIALGMAGALASPSHVSDAKTRAPASIQHSKPKSSYDHKKMLRAIASVESGDKTNVKHAAMGGMHHGGHAYGKYGLTEPVIKDTIKAHKDLQSKHGKAMSLNGKQLHNYMHDNKGLEDTIADRHLSHMEHVLGDSPEHLGYGWLNGAEGALKAKKSGMDIKNHWHAKKIRSAYDKEK